MPLPGFYCQKQDAYYLSDMRNALHHKAYQRTDARINKAWPFDRWKLTLYAEALNVFDRANLRYDNLNGYDPKTGQASLEFMDMLPIVPSVWSGNFEPALSVRDCPAALFLARQ